MIRACPSLSLPRNLDLNTVCVPHLTRCFFRPWSAEQNQLRKPEIKLLGWMIPLVMFKRHPEPSRLERMSWVWDTCRAPIALPMLFPEGFWPALFSLSVVLCNVEATETRSVWCCLRKHRSLWYLRGVVTGVVIGSFWGEYVLVEDSLGNHKALERQKGQKKVYYGWVDLLCHPFLPACVGSQAPGQTKAGYLVFCWVFSVGTGHISQFFISSLVEQ